MTHQSGIVIDLDPRSNKALPPELASSSDKGCNSESLFLAVSKTTGGPPRGHLHHGHLDHHDDRRGGGKDRRGRRGRDDRERERMMERERHEDVDGHFTYRYQNLEEVVGQLISVAKDQNGCRCVVTLVYHRISCL